MCAITGRERLDVLCNPVIGSIKVANTMTDRILRFQIGKAFPSHEVCELRPRSTGRVRKVTKNLLLSKNASRCTPVQCFVNNWPHSDIESVTVNALDRGNEHVLELTP